MIYLFLLGRVLLGGYFLISGIRHFKNLGPFAAYAQSKGVPAPKLAVMGTGLLLFFGGLGILSGAYIKCSVILLSIFFVFVTPKMHAYWTIADPMQRAAEQINFWKNVALWGAVLLLLAIPEPWPYALF